MLDIRRRAGQIKPIDLQEIIDYLVVEKVNPDHFKCVAFFDKEEQKYLMIIECLADNFQEGHFETEKAVKAFAEVLQQIGLTRFELLL